MGLLLRACPSRRGGPIGIAETANKFLLGYKCKGNVGCCQRLGGASIQNRRGDGEKKSIMRDFFFFFPPIRRGNRALEVEGKFPRFDRFLPRGGDRHIACSIEKEGSVGPRFRRPPEEGSQR